MNADSTNVEKPDYWTNTLVTQLGFSQVSLTDWAAGGYGSIALNTYINGKANSLDVSAKLVNVRIMIPLRFVSEAIEKTVIWNDADKTVLIY